MNAYRSIAKQIVDPPAPAVRKRSRLRKWWRAEWPLVVIVCGGCAFVGTCTYVAKRGALSADERLDAERDAKAAKAVCVDRGLEAVRVERIQYGQRRVICLLPDGGTETGVAP